MKSITITSAALAGLSALLSSCVYTPYYDEKGVTVTPSPSVQPAPQVVAQQPVQATVQQPVNQNVVWTTASYDAAGFPIFGYSYGRPVYGYTAAGVAVYSMAALTSLCFVPNWCPASWYHGHYHHPVNIRDCAAPPRYAHGHRPAVRPAGHIHIGVHHAPAVRAPRHFIGGRRR